jgi:hypothetical protein
MPLKYYRHIKSAGWQRSTSISARSKMQRKIMGLLCGFRDRAIIDHKHAEKTITHMFRDDPTNCGHWWSVPARYCTFPRHDNVADINDHESGTPLSGTVILGGGGLIGPTLKALLENRETSPYRSASTAGQLLAFRSASQSHFQYYY